MNINPNEAAAREAFKQIPADIAKEMAASGPEGSLHRILWEMSGAFVVLIGKELDRGTPPATLLWATGQVLGNLAATAVDSFANDDKKNEAFQAVLSHVAAASGLLGVPPALTVSVEMPGQA